MGGGSVAVLGLGFLVVLVLGFFGWVGSLVGFNWSRSCSELLGCSTGWSVADSLRWGSGCSGFSLRVLFSSVSVRDFFLVLCGPRLHAIFFW
jgi:hypothetical protein